MKDIKASREGSPLTKKEYENGYDGQALCSNVVSVMQKTTSSGDLICN